MTGIVPARGNNAEWSGRVGSKLPHPTSPGQIQSAVDNIAKAKALVGSADLQSAMKNAGVVDKPDIYFLNSVD